MTVLSCLAWRCKLGLRVFALNGGRSGPFYTQSASALFLSYRPHHFPACGDAIHKSLSTSVRSRWNRCRLWTDDSGRCANTDHAASTNHHSSRTMTVCFTSFYAPGHPIDGAGDIVLSGCPSVCVCVYRCACESGRRHYRPFLPLTLLSVVFFRSTG